MDYINQFLNKYKIPVIATLGTILLGIILAIFIGPDSDYILFTNVCLTLCFIYLLFRLLFAKDNSYSFMLMGYNLFLIVCANHYYSYNELVEHYEAFKYIDQSLLYLIVVLLVASLFIFLRFISLFSRGSGIRRQFINNTKASSDIEDSLGQQFHNNLQNQQQMQSAYSADKRRMLRVGAITLVAMILFAVICIAMYCFLVLVEHGTGVEKIDMYELVATCTSYGMTLLFVIAAISFIVFILIELALYILNRIKLLFNINSGQAIDNKADAGKAYSGHMSDEYAAASESLQRLQKTNYKSGIMGLSYAISIVIFLSLLYISYKISGQSLQNILIQAVGKDYLALPLTLLATIIAFFIIVRIIHGIILLTLKAKTFRLEVYVIRIGKLIVSIIFRTIIIALNFVKLVPDFLEALHDMVLSDDELEDDFIENNDLDAAINKTVTATDTSIDIEKDGSFSDTDDIDSADIVNIHEADNSSGSGNKANADSEKADDITIEGEGI